MLPLLHTLQRWWPSSMALLACLLALASPRSALAQATRVVLLTEAESSAQPLDAHLLGALRGQLQELQVEVLVVAMPDEPLADTARSARRIARAERALGVIWLELPSSGLSVFLYDSSGHLYARDLRPDGSAVSQSEAIAVILRSAIAALLEGHAVGMTEVQLPPAAPAPVPRAPPRVPARAPEAEPRYLDMGASYVGSLFARGSAWQHGAALTLSAAPTSWPLFFGLDYTYFPAISLDANGVKTELERHPIEAFAGARLRIGGAFFNVQGAVSADYLVRTTLTAREGLLPTPAEGRWLWALSSRLGVEVPVSRRLSGVLNVGADFLLNPFNQVIGSASDGDKLVSSPLLARPRIELGAVVSVW